MMTLTTTTNRDDGNGDAPSPRRPIISAAARHRAAEQIVRCMRTILIAMGRDYERCGKAACARTRRCRGFACEPRSPSRSPRASAAPCEQA